jgi:L-aspartate oxidase
MADIPVFDVLILGSGAAGLRLALEVAPHARVAVLSKGSYKDSSTFHAQGGIAAVLDDRDSVESHIRDTMETGAGLCDPAVVRFIVERGRREIEHLLEWGVEFSVETGPDGKQMLHLTREGGHTRRRVVHAADATGRAVATALTQQAGAHSNITIFENSLAVDLILQRHGNGSAERCVGAYILDNETRSLRSFLGRSVVLATGGSSKVYLYTSNPDGATGDGIAMAWRAGCRIANMEFTQFHPTCLYHPQAKSFLLTEALRGEGAVLRLPDGSTFMTRFHPQADLAPRDVVARAIDHEMKRLGVDCVFLDISHKPARFITERFPTVWRRCRDFGFDLTKGPVPVVPAAHFMCGGVVTDLRGRTDIEGLYAVGEVACTGLHGANRIASNSLLECLVMSTAAAKDILDTFPTLSDPPAPPAWETEGVSDSDEEVVVSHNWHELRQLMWDYVGIVRTTKRLQRAKRRVDMLLNEIEEYFGEFRLTPDLLELRNLSLVADLIIRSALSRKESRGLHYTLDHPEADTSKTPQNTILTGVGPQGKKHQPCSICQK